MHMVTVGGDPAEVRAFLDGARDRFTKDLGQVRSLIEAARQDDRRLACVYKIYSRGDIHPDGEELKHPRKVRLKFEDFHRGTSTIEASLYDVPDIIGLTVVVSYPGDIATVAKAIDELIDGHRLRLAGIVRAPDDRAKKMIASKHGNPIMSDGYFACHYNVRLPGVSDAAPICEIQIKTVLHDAWGVKTHDLTYKPSGKTDRALLRSFDLLGDMLANLDLQSDTLRDSIERAARVREAKRELIQVESLRAPVEVNAARLTEAKDPAAKIYGECFAAITAIGRDSGARQIDDVMHELRQIFDDHLPEACVGACLLAARSRRSGDLQSALEMITEWDRRCSSDLDRLWAKSYVALGSFGIGQTSDAIDAARVAEDFAEGIDRTGFTTDEESRWSRLCNALYSSLAYYHADHIGSHEGKSRESAQAALDYLRKAEAFRAPLGLPAIGLDSDWADIDAVMVSADPATAWRTYSTLTNEGFVRVQTTNSIDEIHALRKRLAELHGRRPDAMRRAADYAFDFQDYCARMRLAELETA